MCSFRDSGVYCPVAGASQVQNWRDGNFWRQASSSVPRVAVDRPMQKLQPKTEKPGVTATRHNLKKARFEKATEGKDVV